MEVAKLSALPNLKVRFVSCNESVIKRWLSSELEETVFSLTHELFMTKHHTVTLNEEAGYKRVGNSPNFRDFLRLATATNIVLPLYKLYKPKKSLNFSYNT